MGITLCAFPPPTCAGDCLPLSSRPNERGIPDCALCPVRYDGTKQNDPQGNTRQCPDSSPNAGASHDAKAATGTGCRPGPGGLAGHLVDHGRHFRQISALENHRKSSRSRQIGDPKLTEVDLQPTHFKQCWYAWRCGIAASSETGQLRLEPRPGTKNGQPRRRLAVTFALGREAEDRGFEPRKSCPLHDFQSCALGH